MWIVPDCKKGVDGTSKSMAGMRETMVRLDRWCEAATEE